MKKYFHKRTFVLNLFVLLCVFVNLTSTQVRFTVENFKGDSGHRNSQPRLFSGYAESVLSLSDSSGVKLPIRSLLSLISYSIHIIETPSRISARFYGRIGQATGTVMHQVSWPLLC